MFSKNVPPRSQVSKTESARLASVKSVSRKVLLINFEFLKSNLKKEEKFKVAFTNVNERPMVLI